MFIIKYSNEYTRIEKSHTSTSECSLGELISNQAFFPRLQLNLCSTKLAMVTACLASIIYVCFFFWRTRCTFQSPVLAINTTLLQVGKQIVRTIF